MLKVIQNFCKMSTVASATNIMVRHHRFFNATALGISEFQRCW